MIVASRAAVSSVASLCLWGASDGSKAASSVSRHWVAFCRTAQLSSVVAPLPCHSLSEG